MNETHETMAVHAKTTIFVQEENERLSEMGGRILALAHRLGWLCILSPPNLLPK